MRKTALFLAAIPMLWAQSAGDRDPLQALKRDLQALRTAPDLAAMATRLRADMLLLAEKTHEPKVPTLHQFARDVGEALAGRTVAPEDLDRLAADIQHVMQSAGTSTVGFWETVRDFEERLAKAGASANRAAQAAAALERVGQEVRGPEGFPVR